MTSYRRSAWQQSRLTDDVRVWLPEISRLMQTAAHFTPPDGRGTKFLQFYQPVGQEEVEWQVRFVVLPKLREWFDPGDISESRLISQEEEMEYLRRKYPGESEDRFKDYQSRSRANERIYPVGIALIMLAPAISHAHLALRALQEDTWGEVANAVSSVGLLSLGEKDVNLDCLHVFLGAVIPSLMNSDPIRDRRVEVYRELDPQEMPILFWQRAFQTLATILDSSHPLLRSFARFAEDIGSVQLAKEIFLLLMQVGHYDRPLHQRVLSYLSDTAPSVSRPSPDTGSVVAAWRELLRQEDSHLDPELVDLLERSIKKYG